MSELKQSSVALLEKAIDDKIRRAVKGGQSTHLATVTRVSQDGTTWVHVYGGSEETPVRRMTTAASVGDVINVTFSGLSCMGVGNVSSPSATEKQVTKVASENAQAIAGVMNGLLQVKRVVADKVSTRELEAEVATVNEALIAKANVTELNAATGRITNLESTRATITQLQAAEARISDIEADYITSTTLEADYIDAGTIEATYMHANMSNSDVAWIQNGTIKNGAITSAMINDVSANKLTAGTINGSVINVTNLNADNITTGTINGQRIGTGSLSLDKLSEDVYTEAEVDAKLGTMQAEIDGAIETWTGTEVPTLNNSPASGWTTNAVKDTHVGDVYFVVNSQSQQNGYNYRFTKTGSAYSWQLIKDSDVTNALQRISAAEGSITQFDSDISQLQTDTGSLATRATSLEGRMGDAEDDIALKVDTTTFNSLSDTVDGHTQTISQHTTAIASKADGSTVTTLSNKVDTIEDTVDGHTQTIGSLQTTVASKADGSALTTVSNNLNTVSDTVDGHTQTISSVQSTLATKADSSTVSTLTTRVSDVEQDVSGFKTTVSGTYATKTELGTETSNRQTAIQQVNDSIALKANSSDVYTKTQTDGLISTEVTNRNAAITAKASEITTSVSETYATKTALADGLEDANDYTDSEISSAKAAIKVTTDGISTEVSKKVGSSEIISKINQSAESVRIAASRVEIDGPAVFSAISGQVDEAIADGTAGLAGLAYDHTWALADGVYTFTGYALRGGADISETLEDEFWTWLLRTEDGDTQLPCGRVLTVPASSAGYRASVVGGLLEQAEFALEDAGGNALTDASGHVLTAQKTIR